MFRPVLPLIAIAAGLHAGVIQGVAIEHSSGRPLARTLIRLEPIPGSDAALQPIVIRSARAGQFVFPSVPPGAYRLIAQRLGFAAAFYGQRRPEGQAAPVVVTSTSELFTELRLRRMGALTGTVFDENYVGVAGVNVVAYKAALPLRSAGRGTSDDRGVYRIGGLPPGRYWIRTAAHSLEDGTGLLPTWSPQSGEVRDARLYEVRLDRETPDANVRPEPGRLFSLRGGVSCDPRIGQITITAISETGRQSVQTQCQGEYQFKTLAPMLYELTASNQDGTQVAYLETNLHGDSVVPLQLGPRPEVFFDTGQAKGVTMTGHRADLAALEPPVKIPIPDTSLVPGYWHFRGLAGPGQFIEAITTRRQVRRPWRPERPADAHEVFIDPGVPTAIRVVVSDKAVQIGGSVTTSGNKVVPGCPVFLWPATEANRRITGGPQEVLSDTHGRFRFDGLPPGDYRLVATFDEVEITPEIVDEAQAPVVRVEAGQSVTLDLSLWLAP